MKQWVVVYGVYIVYDLWRRVNTIIWKQVDASVRGRGKKWHKRHGICSWVVVRESQRERESG